MSVEIKKKQAHQMFQVSEKISSEVRGRRLSGKRRFLMEKSLTSAQSPKKWKIEMGRSKQREFQAVCVNLVK